MYAAIDPVQSEVYEGLPWFLLEISVPAQTKYLDVRPLDEFIFSSKFVHDWFQDDLKSNSIIVRFGENTYFVPMRKILAYPNFKNVFLDTFKKLKTDFIADNWSSHTIQHCIDLSDGQGIAFNFVNPVF